MEGRKGRREYRMEGGLSESETKKKKREKKKKKKKKKRKEKEKRKTYFLCGVQKFGAAKRTG
jgi:hypothetical protein